MRRRQARRVRKSSSHRGGRAQRLARRPVLSSAAVKPDGSPGRPKCSPVLLSIAADLVSQGKSIREAAAFVGVSERSLRRFLYSQKTEPDEL